jgi:hypothetical protein
MKPHNIMTIVSGLGLTAALALTMAKSAGAEAICGESFIVLPSGRCEDLSYLTELGRQRRNIDTATGVSQPQAQNPTGARGQAPQTGTLMPPVAQGRSLWREHTRAMEMMGRAF